MTFILASGTGAIFTNADLWSGTLREATPLALAAVGGVISERSGVVNIGMEGMMLAGAFFAFVADITFASAMAGFFAAIIAGGLLALLLAFAAVRLRADQIVIGMAINLIALGLTSYLNFAKYANGTPSACTPPTPCTSGQFLTIPDWSIPVLHKIPVLGPIFFELNPIVYLMFVIVIAVQFFIFRTTLGLRIRSVGEHPRAADTAGINVQRLRYFSVIVSGLLSGLAGAYLVQALSIGFSDNMTAGRGFIALAAMIFGKWTPLGAFGACLLFGFGQSIYDHAQSTPGVLQDYATILAMLPYVLTIVALAGFIGRATPPAADGIPYDPAGG